MFLAGITFNCTELVESIKVSFPVVKRKVLKYFLSAENFPRE